MRRIIASLGLSLDGMIEGPNQEIDWLEMDPELDFMDFLALVDTVIYGRKSYVLYGPHAHNSWDPSEGDPSLPADLLPDEMSLAIQKMKQVVISSSITTAEEQSLYHPATWLNGNDDQLLQAIHELKQQPGKDIWFYGGAVLYNWMAKHDLIDEYHLGIAPIILGPGHNLFAGLERRYPLTLKSCKHTSKGYLMLVYERNR